MAQWHLKQLQEALRKIGWRVVEELPGDGNSFSGYWRIQRDAQTFQLALYGLHEDGVLPVEKAYACYLTEAETVDLYFSHHRETWQRTLDNFLIQLNKHSLIVKDSKHHIEPLES